MFIEERHQQILERLERDGRVTVADLSKVFGVTEDCIRKDLKQLAAAGKCRRVYGGAIKVETPAVREVSGRIDMLVPEKQEIARKAFALIKPKQTIFLDISTSNLHLARLIAQSDIECSVVSPMIDIHTTLAKCPNVRAICPGGTMHPELNGFVGALTVDTLRRFRFELSFLGAFGINAEACEVTTYDMDDGLAKTTAIECTAHSYLVSEVRKLGMFGAYRYAGFSDFDALICENPDGEEAAAVRDAGLEVL